MTLTGLTEFANFRFTRPTPNFFINSSKFSVFKSLYLPAIWKKDQNEKKWFDENFLYLLPIGSAAGGGNTSIMADFVSS